MSEVWINPKTIESSAESCLDRFHSDRTIPTPIEKIIEDNLINIIPLPGIRAQFGSSAAISNDLSEIQIDQTEYDDHEFRARFSMSHEFGHYILHEKHIRSLTLQKIPHWKDYMQKTQKNGIDAFEFQADEFAGCILMPKKQFLKELESEVTKKIKSHPILKQHPELIQATVKSPLSKIFRVTEPAVLRRLDRLLKVHQKETKQALSI